MANLSWENYQYEYDLFLPMSYANLTPWQLSYIKDFPDEGKQCMIDFWSSPAPQGIFGFILVNFCWFFVAFQTSNRLKLLYFYCKKYSDIYYDLTVIALAYFMWYGTFDIRLSSYWLIEFVIFYNTIGIRAGFRRQRGLGLQAIH